MPLLLVELEALECWHRAGELGGAKAYNSVGYAYEYGECVEVDEKKATHYCELAVIRGCVMARHNLGTIEDKVIWIGHLGIS